MCFFLRTAGHPAKDEEIKTIEQNYRFSFPTSIKQFYLKHNGAKIYEIRMNLNGDIYEIVRFLELKTIEMLLAEFRIRSMFDGYIPFAEDWGDNMYCWNKNDGKVYLVYLDSDESLLIADSAEHFWQIVEHSELLTEGWS